VALLVIGLALLGIGLVGRLRAARSRRKREDEGG
jgi:hypothetical protein